jgi:hypothetical protein
MDILLQFDTYGPHPASTREQLILFADGSLVLKVTSAASPTRQDQAGTWAVQLDPDRLNAARQLAADLAGFSAENLHAQRGALSRTLTLGPDTAGPSFPLNTEEPLPPPLSAAAELHKELQAAAEIQPLAVVRLETALRASSGGEQLVCTFSNPGSAAIEFILDAGSIALTRALSGETVWQNPGQPIVGLVAADGALIDGFTVPASLTVGAQASIVFPITTSNPLSAEGLSTSAAGTISLVLPGGQLPPYPDTPFRLRHSITGAETT